MQRILVITIWLCSLTVAAQHLEKLEKQNTLFILFEEDALFKKEKLIPKKQEVISYTFYVNKEKSNEKKLYAFMLYFQLYKSPFDAKNKINPAITFRVHKNFLKKNSDIILTKKDLDTLGEHKVIQLFKNKNKHLFVIDKSETKNNKILIRKVNFSRPIYE